MPNRTSYVLEVMEAMEFAKTKSDLTALRVQYPNDIVDEAWGLVADAVKAHVQKVTANG